MSRVAERYDEILDEIVRPFDLTHDFGRKRAYEAAIEYARENLASDPHCNDFLIAAATRLDFAPVTFDTIESRVKLPKNAWLDVWISDEDDEVALTGTTEGLQYLIDLLTQLRDSDDPEQHIHLDRGFTPMTENTANLVLFKEEETWFTGASSEVQEYPQRDLEPKSIYAIQFIHYPPDDLPISAHKLYRVLRVENATLGGTESIKEFGEGTEERYHRFTFIADNDERFGYTFHLDDPAVNFFTHREILSLAMKSV